MYKTTVALKFIFCFLFFAQTTTTLFGIDLDKPFVQNFSEQLFKDLQLNPGKLRAFFIGEQKAVKQHVLYLKFDALKDEFVVMGNLTSKLEKRVSLHGKNVTEGLFSPLKKNNEPLYTYGTCLRFSFKQAECQYVPHMIKDKANECFVSDLGYLQFRFPAHIGSPDQLCKDLIAHIFDKKIQIAPKVPLNRYYLFRDNYYGPVHYFYPQNLARAQELCTFPPVHKLTMNKQISDWELKAAQDLKLHFEILNRQRFLLSQDLRLKMGMVPAHVKLNWNRIKESDIGSGQNMFVFLSLGPGINYFDDPWRQPRKNLPCPRILFDKSILGFKELQLYPTFSIEPREVGENRLAAINSFQSSSTELANLQQRTPSWLRPNNRAKVIKTIEQGLCAYNLLNDSPELRPGFKLSGQQFDGNIVNNEIRLKDGVSLRSLLKATIVPPDSKETYQNRYIQSFRNQSPHWQFICGTRFTDLFFEAPTPDDKGFRTAWLHWQLQQSHPLLVRLLARAKKMHTPKLQIFIAEMIARIAQKEKTAFFATPYAQHRRAIEVQRLRLWCEYLEAYRNKNSNASELLIRFIKHYNYYEKRLEP